jgi:hypothetical protein
MLMKMPASPLFSWQNRRVIHTGFIGGWLALWSLPIFLVAQSPRQTVHVRGPNGLEGWKLTSIIETLENQGPLPTELVLARRGRIIRHVKDEAFIWNWMFLPDGRHVAYETGPLHFGVDCVLLNIKNGRTVRALDCGNSHGGATPGWVKSLESHTTDTP